MSIERISDTADKAWGVGMLIGLSTLGGYLRMTARDLAYGDQPRQPRSVGEAFKLGLAAMAQGGGLGIFADALFGDINRLGGSATSAFGGPVGTDISKINEIYNRYMQSIGTNQKGDVWPEIGRFALGHIPFANLFYVKSAMDYLVMYHLFEAMKPGWWHRTNEMMKKQQGRTMMGYKPGSNSIPSFPPQLGG
jgi:hypothetical protein